MALSVISWTLFHSHSNPIYGHHLQHQINKCEIRTIRCLANTQKMEPATMCRTNYWDNDHIKSLRHDHKMDHYENTRVEELKKHGRCLLYDMVDPVSQLELIDAMQRLGIDYHFKDEIKSVLDNTPDLSLSDCDLYATALLFRLLRRHGRNVPQETFHCFKDEMGNFKPCLSKDVKGMLSLYEACHLGFEGEVVIDEAKAFATKHLEETMEGITPTLLKKVAHSIELPFCQRFPRAEARWYMDIYESEENMKPDLLELAKLDYNIVQARCQKELGNVVRWWEDLGLQHLDFVRGKLMISFIWSLGIGPEPHFGHSRETLSKLCILSTVIDDLYDTCESLEELELFTNSIERWNVSAMEQLPQYMKPCFMSLLNTTNIIAYDILITQGYDITMHQREAWVKQCKAFLMEAKNSHQEYVPTYKEYFGNAVYSIGMQMGLLNCYFLTANVIAREALECIENMHDLVYCTVMMLRLANDLGSSTDKEKKGTVQIHMHEEGVSEEVARAHVKHLIGNVWKKLNKAMASPHPFPWTFERAVLSVCQLAICGSMFEDQNVDPNEILDNLMSLVFEPIPLD